MIQKMKIYDSYYKEKSKEVVGKYINIYRYNFYVNVNVTLIEPRRSLP